MASYQKTFEKYKGFMHDLKSGMTHDNLKKKYNVKSIKTLKYNASKYMSRHGGEPRLPKLPVQALAAYFLHSIGCSHTFIAESLGIPRGSIQYYVMRATGNKYQKKKKLSRRDELEIEDNLDYPSDLPTKGLFVDFSQWWFTANSIEPEEFSKAA